MSFDPNNVPLEYLLQPELLNERDILNILEARCIRVEDMNNLTKEQLVDLFYRVITPKQQRTNTRRSSSNMDTENVNKKLKKNGQGICENRNLCDRVALKRSSNTQLKDEPKAKKVRQKICWP